MGARQLFNVATESGAKKKFGKMATAGLAINGAFAYSDYKTARDEGSSRIGSLAKAGSTFAMGEILSVPAMLAFYALPAVPKLAIGAMEGIGKMQRQMNSDARRIPFSHSNFNDYQQAFTMRQAGMQLAQNSQYNLQQTLMGNEASYLK